MGATSSDAPGTETGINPGLESLLFFSYIVCEVHVPPPAGLVFYGV
jgi:hypothetical protein